MLCRSQCHEDCSVTLLSFGTTTDVLMVMNGNEDKPLEHYLRITSRDVAAAGAGATGEVLVSGVEIRVDGVLSINCDKLLDIAVIVIRHECPCAQPG